MADYSRDTLDKEQLTRLAQYFDEAVMSARDYKNPRGGVSHLSKWAGAERLELMKAD
jgi:hypothetical protein